MNLHDVVTLLNAGYSKAEIEAMTQNETEPQEHTQVSEPEPEPEIKPAETPVLNETEQPDAKYIALENKLNQLLGIVQAENLNQGIETMNRRTAQDALASVISPPRKERLK